jgi:hypothetical protein
MPEEKKPNLKDRLKKTTAGPSAMTMPPVAGLGPSAAKPGGSLPPPAVLPGFGTNGGAPQPFVPGVPGLGDVAPPAFVLQQQQAAEAAARARALSDDPFGATSAAPAGPQEVRLVIDEKPVDAKEIGRSRTGLVLAVLVVGLAGAGAGYLIGGTTESKHQEAQTIAAVAGVRSEITRLGDVINQLKTHVDHAADRGNIVIARAGQDDSEAPQAAQTPTHAPDVDEELLSWFREQPPDPPMSPDVYAGRVGRLKTQVVQKLTLVQLETNEVWRQLQAHARMTNPTSVRAAMNVAINPQTNDVNRMLVTFARGPQGGLVGQLVTLAGPQTQQGQALIVPIGGANIAANQTRTLYQAGPLTAETLPTYAIPVLNNVGLGVQMQASAILPWVQYRQRVSDLKSRTDQLQVDAQQLLDALQSRSSS